MYQQIGGDQEISSHTLKRITADPVELYCAVHPLGLNIPTSMMPDHIYESVPKYEEVEWEVQRLQGHR